VIGTELDPAMADREPLRPLRDMILLLPHIDARAVGSEFVLDWASAEPALLAALYRNSEITMRTVNRGVSAIGRLMVNVSPEIALGEFSADFIADIGWTLGELGDLACVSHQVMVACQRHISDYSPPAPKHFPTTKP